MWNSGIFLLPVQAFLKHVPPILRQRLEAIYQSGDWIESDFVAPKAAYTQLPNISIDHAFFENAPDARVIKADFAWRDIGTWATLNELQHEQAKAVEYA